MYSIADSGVFKLCTEVGFRRYDGTTLFFGQDRTAPPDTVMFTTTQSSYAFGPMIYQKLRFNSSIYSYKAKVLGALGHLSRGQARGGVLTSLEIADETSAVRLGTEVRWWYGYKPTVFVFLSKDLTFAGIIDFLTKAK
jgi:hypothetical protein